MRKRFILFTMSFCVFFSGCSFEKYLEEKIIEKAGIKENEDYKKYQKYMKEEKFDKNGKYIGNEFDDETETVSMDGLIHVTFAENNYMIIEYYKDSSKEQLINKELCYLNPGDTIYGQVIKYTNQNSNSYRITEYRIREYDQEQNVENEECYTAEGETIQYKIPENFEGTELAIIPVGNYLARRVSVRTYYKDDSGKEYELGNAGTWSVNEEKVEGTIVEVNATESYTLKYQYDDDNFFVVKTEPEAFTTDFDESDYIEFWEMEATQDNLDYSVELHNYLNLSLKCTEDAKISVNGKKNDEIDADDEWKRGKLKYGDTIVIETEGECTIIDGDYRHVSAVKDNLTKGYRYTLTMKEEVSGKNANTIQSVMDVICKYDVSLSEKGDYGICTYTLDGEDVTGDIQIKENQELELTYKITKDGYCFAEDSEGISGFFHDIFYDSERTITIPITDELDGIKINPDKWFKIVQEGE